ncbi:MAG: FKBP-type peptidyl-prolyl cis-trans isomerase [Bacteroidales bacterium]|nr:FKBP-type peptidyl-prolyl cis-trans isomerase [Bacteroidales bacterium]
MKASLYLLTTLIILGSTACREEGGSTDKKGKISNEQLAEINRQLVIKDRERIMSYIERKGLDMRETGTGLWISADATGKGDIREGDRVALEYKCSLLDGTVVYDSNKDGMMNFVVGRSDVPSGLDEGVKLLAEGDEAILIMPGYLGYGLLGDEKNIPPRSILVYSIKLVEVK